ncbi:hypothetical protein V5O48_018228, partial [Marasmius crinis-equi]
MTRDSSLLKARRYERLITTGGCRVPKGDPSPTEGRLSRGDASPLAKVGLRGA